MEEELWGGILWRGGGGGGGGGGGEGVGIAGVSGGGTAIETAAPGEKKVRSWEEGDGFGLLLILLLVLIILLDKWLASLYLYLSISALTALSSACKTWTCCCNAEIAPIQP